MVKYLFLILVALLSGCTTDFSGLDKLEESVYIRFSSRADVKVDIEEASYTHGRNTRGDETSKHSVGILGIASNENLMHETTLAGHQLGTLCEWMANDVYYRNPNTGDIVHEDEKKPSFPINKGSAIVAYAYMPHSEQVTFEAEDCYIPIDLREDSATTDWRYSSKAMSKAEYRDCEDGAFTLDAFEHVMTCLDLVLHSYEDSTTYMYMEILEVDLKIKNGQGRLSLVNGEATMQDDKEPMHLLRRINKELRNENSTHTERYYLFPYTEIDTIRIKGVWVDSYWNTRDAFSREYAIVDSIQWNSENLHPGTCSTIRVKSLKYADSHNGTHKMR